MKCFSFLSTKQVNDAGGKSVVNERRHDVPYKGQPHKFDLTQLVANPEQAAHCCWTNDVIWNTDISWLHSAHAPPNYGQERLRL